MQLRPVMIFLTVLLLVGVMGYQAELSLPGSPPDIHNTYTPLSQSAPREIGSYDVLGYTVSKAEADQLLQTAEGQTFLSPDQGAVEITEDLIALGRDAFYLETFGNDVLFTDILGILDGPLNIGKIAQAVLALGDKPTSYRVPQLNGMSSLAKYPGSAS